MINKTRCGWDAIILLRSGADDAVYKGYVIDGQGNHVSMTWDSNGIPIDKNKYPERYFLEIWQH